jgi:type I restriction enzyme, S subunit
MLNIATPPKWSWRPMKHVTAVLSRGTAPDYVDDGPIRMISQAANQASGLNWKRTRLHHFHGDARKLKGYLKHGDVIINSTGTGTLGRVGFYTAGPDHRPCVADAHVTVVRARPDVVEPRFMYYWLTSEPFQEYIYAALVVGATNQIELNRERLAAAPTPMPPIGEQRRIADFLDAETASMDRLVKLQAMTLESLRERREAGVHAEVTGRRHGDRRESGLAWTQTLPSSWKTVKLAFLARMGSGHTPSRSHPEWWVECTIPWITTGEVSQIRDDRREVIIDTRERISEAGLANSAAELHPKGTVVLCRTAASAGYSAVMGQDMATSQDFVTWTCGLRLDPFYLLWCFRAMRQDLLGRLAMGSTHKTIYVPDLQMLRVPLPKLGEQREIVTRIREANRRIDELADAIDRQLALLAERRKALITAAVIGQIDVTMARRER